MRRADEKKALDEKEQKQEDDAGTMDAASRGQSEFDRFEDLTKKLLNTPKPPKDDD